MREPYAADSLGIVLVALWLIATASGTVMIPKGLETMWESVSWMDDDLMPPRWPYFTAGAIAGVGGLLMLVIRRRTVPDESQETDRV